MPGNLSDLTTTTQSRKVRLKQLAQQLAVMEAAAARHNPIPVIRLEPHQRRPRNLPTDALIIHLGSDPADPHKTTITSPTASEESDVPPTSPPGTDGGDRAPLDGQPTPTP